MIGDGCKIQNNVSIYDNVFLEDEVFCGPSMVFTNVYNPRSAVEKNEYRDTIIKSYWELTVLLFAEILLAHIIRWSRCMH